MPGPSARTQPSGPGGRGTLPPTELASGDSVPPPAGAALPVGSVVGGRYRVLSSLGNGAQGEVLAVEHMELGKRFAMKVLRPRAQGSPWHLSRLRAEARLVAKLRNPHIVDVSDLGQGPDGHPFMVMEYLQGAALDTLLDRHGPLPWSWLRPAALQMLEALEAAHSAGVIHRDIKPSNAFACGEEPLAAKAHVKLLDFGIAKAQDAPPTGDPTTATGAVLGTPRYMSPEQVRSATLGPESDLYSLAVTLYELVSGTAPFTGTSLLEIASKHLTEPPPVLEERHPELALPDGLGQVLVKALAKEPWERFANAREFADAIAGLEPAAEEPAVLQRARPVRRPKPSAPPQDSTYDVIALSRLAQHVRTSWVEGALNRALHTLGQLPSRYTLDFDCVSGAMAVSNDPLGPDPQALDVGLVFEEHGRSLLILGEAGAGKTTQLLLLCRQLLEAFEADPNEAVPVVLGLSTWQRSEPDLHGWMLRELASKYQTPIKIARRWIEDGRLIPLLDGLDELDANARAGCVEAINEFIQTYGAPGIAVSCRTRGYSKLATPLRLRAGLQLHELYDADVDACLDRLAKSGASDLAQQVRSEAPLWDAARSPLLLRLVAEVGTGQGTWNTDASGSAVLDRLYSAYLKSLVDARSSTGAAVSALLDPLSKLASAMLRQGRSVFLVEELQPSWLRSVWSRRAFVLLTRALGAAILASAFIVPIGLSPLNNLGFQTSLAFGGQLACLSALTLGTYYAARDLVRSRPGAGRLRRTAWALRGRRVVEAVALGGVNAALVGAGAHPAASLMGFQVAFASALLLGARWDEPPMTRAVQPLEALRWSSSALKRRLPGVVGAAAGLAAIAGYVEGVIVGTVAFTSVVAFGIPLVAVRGRSVDDCEPGRALKRTFRYAFTSAALACALGGLAFGAVYGVLYGCGMGLFFGTIAWLWFGGLGLLHHALLRLLLTLERTLPLRLGSTLRRAEELLPLQPVGSGHMFMHRSLATFLAERSEAETLH